MNIITIDASSLERAEKVLANIPGGAQKALGNAMQRAAQHFRTNASKQIRERYAISNGNLRTDQTMNIQLTRGNPVTARIKFDGNKIPLIRYDGSGPQAASKAADTVPVMIAGHWRMAHPNAGGARGHVLRSTGAYSFGTGAFVATMASGHTGIFYRSGGATSSGSDAIKQIMGLSVPEMIGNEEVADKIMEQSMEKFDQRLEHEISRLLAGG